MIIASWHAEYEYIFKKTAEKVKTFHSLKFEIAHEILRD